MTESKADWIEDICPTCTGKGRLAQTPEEFEAARKKGILTAPLCPSCGGIGRVRRPNP